MATIIQTADRIESGPLTPDETSWVYNGLDCAVTAEIWEALQEERDPQADAIYALSKALQGPILDMNMHGIMVDLDELARLKTFFSMLLERLETQLAEIFRDGYGIPNFNWRSPTQTKWFLYEFLGCPKQTKRAANGGRSLTADRNALERLSYIVAAQPFIFHVLALRDAAKRLSFLETEMDPDGFMRCNFNIAGTNTGRLSSSHSDMGTGGNFQNIERRLRRIFVAPKGKILVNLDLEQADSRNVGAECWNTLLPSHGPSVAGAYLDACESGDLHTTVTRMGWTSLDWGSDPKGFRAVADRNAYRDYTFRDLAKRLGHGSNYLGMPPTMAMHVKIPVSIAAEFQRAYFQAFQCIPDWHSSKIAELRNYGCLTTLWGRRRFFFGRLNEKKVHGEAIAYLGQSATADEVNRGMLRLWREGKRWPGFQLLAQVHDSCLFEVNEECLNECVPWAVEALRVPLLLREGREFVVPTEAKVGWNWADFTDSNPDGIRKWKGTETRKRQSLPTRKITFK